ncbi:MAG: HEAT repeat domain-containing protein [Acidobacteriota bacterium]
MKILRIATTAVAATLAARHLSAQPENLRDAKITVERAGAGSLSARLAALASSDAPRWIVWSAPGIDRRVCCFNGGGAWQAGSGAALCGRCALEREDSVPVEDRGDGGGRLEAADLLIFAKARRGTIERLRYFSRGCEIDAGGMPVVWLEGVPPEESVAWLESLASRSRADDGEDREEDRRPEDAAVGAIALHFDASADAALVRFLAPGRPRSLRTKAAFWLAAARGRRGCRLLAEKLPGDPDAGFRKHGTFALSLCESPGGVETLLAMARRDPAGKVRGQALFWLAQKAGRKAAAAIEDAIRDDPDTDVKRQAVFALTRLPEGEGVSELIRVARTNRNPEVRRQAIFWLGQSEDPRALDFIEEILTR